MSTALPKHLQELLVNVIAGEIEEECASVQAARVNHPEFARELDDLRLFERGFDALRGERDDILAEARADTGTRREADIEARILALGADFRATPGGMPKSLWWGLVGLMAAAAALLILRPWQPAGDSGEGPNGPPLFLNGEEEASIALQRPERGLRASELDRTGGVVLVWDLRDQAIPIDGYTVELLGADLGLIAEYRTSTNTWSPDSEALKALLDAQYVRVRALDPFGLPYSDVVSIPYPRELFVVLD